MQRGAKRKAVLCKGMEVERGQRQYKGRSFLLRREVAAGPWLGCLFARFTQC
jgi:hypothetical protein